MCRSLNPQHQKRQKDSRSPKPVGIYVAPGRAKRLGLRLSFSHPYPQKLRLDIVFWSQHSEHMLDAVRMCGHWISKAVLERITARTEATEPPSRKELLQEFCRSTQWRNRKGHLCLSSANVCLKRLEQQKLVRLPPPAHRAPRAATRKLFDDGKPLPSLPTLPRSVEQIPDLRDKRSKLINIIDQYAEILPKEEHVQHEAFVNIIDGYRKDTKIIIQKAEYVKSKDDEKKQKQDNFVRHRYKFKLLGTVPDFIEFVNKIENHTRFLKVDAIYIKPVGSADDNTDDIGEKADDQELAIALEQVKEIELTVSTYTYSKGQEKKI